MLMLRRSLVNGWDESPCSCRRPRCARNYVNRAHIDHLDVAGTPPTFAQLYCQRAVLRVQSAMSSCS